MVICYIYQEVPVCGNMILKDDFAFAGTVLFGLEVPAAYDSPTANISVVAVYWLTLQPL